MIQITLKISDHSFRVNYWKNQMFKYTTEYISKHTGNLKTIQHNSFENIIKKLEEEKLQ